MRLALSGVKSATMQGAQAPLQGSLACRRSPGIAQRTCKAGAKSCRRRSAAAQALPPTVSPPAPSTAADAPEPATAAPLLVAAAFATSAPTPAPAVPDQPSESPAAPAWSGSWTKQWYAVGAVADFDASKPQPFTLLGKHLVVWRAADGTWGCLEDRCPHRAVPLSEGKVWSDGTLMCSYHGWRFDESGACKAIPQASSADAEAAAAASRRACAVSHPIRERNGMLFVWGEGGAAAALESALVEPPASDLADDGAPLMRIIPAYTRDLPYDFTALLENVVDPSHVPWSHHGVMGNRDKQEFGMWDLSKEGDMAVCYNAGFADVTITYKPPGYLEYSAKPKVGRSVMSFWLTPIAPGRSRITLSMDTNRGKSLPLPFKLMAKLPPFVDHIRTRSAVFDGDNVFLNAQDRILAEATLAPAASPSASPSTSAGEAASACNGANGTANSSANGAANGATAAAGADQPAGGDAWRKLYYMPTAADALVATVRNWLDTQAGGGPFGSLRDASSPAALAARAAAAAAAPLGSTEASRRVLLDRFEQHTRHCASCRGALKMVTLLRQISTAAATVAAAACLLPFLIAFASAAAPAAAARAAGAASASSLLAAAASRAWLPGLAAVVLGAASLLLGKLRDAFIFTDYVHAHR